MKRIFLLCIFCMSVAATEDLFEGRALNFDPSGVQINLNNWKWMDNTQYTPDGGVEYYSWCIVGTFASPLLHYEHPIAWRFPGRGSNNNPRQIPEESNIYPYHAYYPNFSSLKSGWDADNPLNVSKTVALSGRNTKTGRASHNTAKDEVTRFYLAAHRAMSFGNSYGRVLYPSTNHSKIKWALNNLGFSTCNYLPYSSAESVIRSKLLGGEPVLAINTSHAYMVEGYRSSDQKYQITQWGSLGSSEWKTYGEMANMSYNPYTFIYSLNPNRYIYGGSSYRFWFAHVKGDAYIPQSDANGLWSSTSWTYYVKPCVENRSSSSRTVEVGIKDEDGVLVYSKDVAMGANSYWVEPDYNWVSYTVNQSENLSLSYYLRPKDSNAGDMRCYLIENGY